VNPLQQLARRAQRRWWAVATLRGALTAATLSAGALALLAIARSVGLWPLPVEVALLYAAGVLAAALVVGLVVAIVRAPTQVQLAARIDRDAGLHERLSTALELTSSDQERELVARAAVEDAMRHLPRAQLHSAIPLRWPRWAWALPLAAVLNAALLSIQPVDAVVVSERLIEAPSLPSTLTRERVEASVERVVAVLERDPVRGRDPYVQAVSESLSELAQRVRDGDIDPSAALFEFDRLMAHLQRAVSERPEDDPIATLVNRYFDQGAATDDGGRPDEAVADRNGSDPAAATAPAAERRVQTAASSAANADNRSMESLLEDLERALADALAAAEAMPAPLLAEDTSGDFFYGVDVDAARERQAAAQRQRGEAQGTPIGGAEESDDRPGDAAGFGTQDGSSDAAGGLTGEASLDEDVIVAGRELEGRRRVQIEGDPGGVATPRTGGASLEMATPLHRIEDAVRLAGSSSVYTDIVRNYFLPDASLSADARNPLEER
jgi:hypothetical protein